MSKLKEINIKKARKFIADKQKEINNNRHELFLKASFDFKKIIELIIKKYNLKRIYQWGSLLNENHFSEISDIDIALEGLLSAEDYFNLIGEAMKLTDFSLDIVELEKIDPVHRNSIIKKGKLIYERK